MRVLFVADGRSPIALNWIQYFVDCGDEVHLASTFPCRPELHLASLSIVPVAFSQSAGVVWQAGSPGGGGRSLLKRTSPRLRTAIRQWLGPATLPAAAARLREVIGSVQPDLVHAMRIPYEGMLAAAANPAAPLLVSVWGNDFTLHAPANPWMRRLTLQAMIRADALHTDCCRDQRMAREWGFSASKPAVVLPGGGGVRPEVFHPPASERERAPLVVNPRALRPYVRSDTFFRAIPLVRQMMPAARFACVAMAGQPEALGWISSLGIDPAAVDLLTPQSREQMAALFRQARAAVSPSTHDGTPNTLLEAMACGCFPVAGDLESLREWIEPGVNGLLVDPADPQALAAAVLQALEDHDLRRRAQAINQDLISRRAAYGTVMRQAREFYQSLRA